MCIILNGTLKSKYMPFFKIIQLAFTSEKYMTIIILVETIKIKIYIICCMESNTITKKFKNGEWPKHIP